MDLEGNLLSKIQNGDWGEGMGQEKKQNQAKKILKPNQVHRNSKPKSKQHNPKTHKETNIVSCQ